MIACTNLGVIRIGPKCIGILPISFHHHFEEVTTNHRIITQDSESPSHAEQASGNIRHFSSF